MRKLRILAFIVTLASILLFVPLAGVWAWLQPLPDSVQEQLDASVELGLDGIIVHVDRAGISPASYTAGWKDRAQRLPANPNALFKIASISKLYIAVAAAKLASAGTLSLDDSLAQYLPDLASRIENAEGISLRMLLQHRSGIPNYVDDEDFDWGEPRTEISENLTLVLDEPADFPPNTDYRYSNTNYLLIGRILDAALGYGHQQYIRREIVAPLGLTETYGVLSEVALADVVSGYHAGFEQDFKPLEFTVPGGSMVATAHDVGVFLRALNDGSLLSEEEQAIYSSLYEYGHAGWVLGYQSIARYHEGIDTVVVQFVNSTGDDIEMLANVTYGRIVRILERNQPAP